MRSNTSRGEDPRPATPFQLLRAVAVAVAMLALGLTALHAPTLGAAEASDGPTAAAWAASWLDGQLTTGIPLQPYGSPDWGTTVEAGLALASIQGNEARTDEVWEAVVAERETVVAATGADVPGRLALVILFALAIGEDPTAVGDAPGDDLVARLVATRTVGGADDGLFGSSATLDPTYDGAYRQGYSLAALVAVGETPDQSAIDWLLDQQCDDGSWMPYRADTSQPCAFDGGAFVGPDSNSTAAALAGLGAVGLGSAPAVDDAAQWLDDEQGDDGGWGFFPGDASDPNSTAVVIMSLRSLGLLADAAFTDRDQAPLAALLDFQLGCDEGPDAGAFTFPGSNGAPNTFATVQGQSAAAGATLGITGPVVAGPFDDPCAAAAVTTPTTPAPGAPGPGGPSPSPSVSDQGAVRPAELAFTGPSSSAAAVGGLALLLVGAVVLGATRRRRA